MHLNCACFRFILFLVVRLCLTRASRCPGTQGTQTESCIFFASERRFSILAELLRVCEISNTGVEFS
jgi:hypothetical protein